jgi:hypothetical protein
MSAAVSGTISISRSNAAQGGVVSRLLRDKAPDGQAGRSPELSKGRRLVVGEGLLRHAPECLAASRALRQAQGLFSRLHSALVIEPSKAKPLDFLSICISEVL